MMFVYDKKMLTSVSIATYILQTKFLKYSINNLTVKKATFQI